MDLSAVELFLLDMDGTLYIDGKLIDGTISALEAMRNNGKKICFLTNNSSRNGQKYYEKLNNMGIKAFPDEIMTSGHATIAYLKNNYPNQKICLLGTDALKKEFIDNGIILDDNADIAVMGYDTELTYKKLCAFSDALNRNALYICTHADFVCPMNPYPVPDNGSMIELFKAATGRTPQVICGKPYNTMGDIVMKKYGLSSEKIAMVGDRLYTDIRFANNNNFVSVLVLSGETDIKMYNESTDKADVVLNNIGELPERFNFNKNRSEL